MTEKNRASATLTQAIVRPPGASFASGLTTSRLGPPDVALALDQHERYCRALEKCGLVLHRLDADEDYPDSTFVEDAAVATPRGAIIARPGALSRRGEVAAVREALASRHRVIGEIRAPGTLDAGDVLEADGRYIVGISERTDEEGARQLGALLESLGFPCAIVDARRGGLLHLKSGAAHLGGGRLAVVDSLAGLPELSTYDSIRVPAEEEYAANCVRVNEHLLIASGFPIFEAVLRDSGYGVIALDVSEFRKMDGGLSCLSIRF